MKPPYAIGSVPSLSGHAIAYRWRSLPRVRRHRASKPQGSSERVLPWQITMDQLIFASLSHTQLFDIGSCCQLQLVQGTLLLLFCIIVVLLRRTQSDERQNIHGHSDTTGGPPCTTVNFFSPSGHLVGCLASYGMQDMCKMAAWTNGTSLGRMDLIWYSVDALLGVGVCWR